MEGFPIWILLEFGVVSIFLDEKRLPLLEHNEDHFSGLGGRYFAVSCLVWDNACPFQFPFCFTLDHPIESVY